MTWVRDMLRWVVLCFVLVLVSCSTLMPTPTPVPTPTPDFGSMVDRCESDRINNKSSYHDEILEGATESELMRLPVEEPPACRMFREQYPDEFASMMKNTISGTFVLYDEDILPKTLPGRFVAMLGRICYASGGYGDIKGGAEVIVKDGAGKVIGKGSLWEGRREGQITDACAFPFQVTFIPDADFYEIEVGRRGSLIFSHRELESIGWLVGFELGR